MPLELKIAALCKITKPKSRVYNNMFLNNTHNPAAWFNLFYQSSLP